MSMRRDSDKNKQEILSTLESMKNKGRIDTEKLAKFGINVNRFNRTDKSMLFNSSPSKYDNFESIDSVEVDVSAQMTIQSPQNDIEGFESTGEVDVSAQMKI